MLQTLFAPGLRLPVLVIAAALLGACASDPGPQPTRVADPVDMSGFWEVDYARSDNLQARYSALIRQLRQDAARRAQAAERGQPVAGGTSQEAVLGLAQMAEIVTGAQLLEVEQSRVAVRVEREGNFSLNLSLIHISEPTRRACRSRMPSSA